MNEKNNGLATASFIVGIVSLVLLCCFGGIGGIVGLALGIVALTQHPKNKGMAIAGVVISSIAIVGFLIFMFIGMLSPDTETATTEDIDSETTTEEITTEEPTTEEITTTEEPTTEAAVSAEDFKASCISISYKDLLRNPDDYVGQNIKIDLKIAQTGIPGSWLDSGEYMRAYSKSDYDLWYGDTYIIIDNRVDDDTKILVDDIITVYGTYEGVAEMELALTETTEEYPLIDMEYMDLIGE